MFQEGGGGEGDLEATMKSAFRLGCTWISTRQKQKEPVASSRPRPSDQEKLDSVMRSNFFVCSRGMKRRRRVTHESL